MNRYPTADFAPDKVYLDKPVFFGATLLDYICLAEPSKMAVKSMCKNLKVVEFETDHWVMLAAPEKFNEELHNWIKELRVVPLPFSQVGKPRARAWAKVLLAPFSAVSRLLRWLLGGIL